MKTQTENKELVTKQNVEEKVKRLIENINSDLTKIAELEVFAHYNLKQQDFTFMDRVIIRRMSRYEEIRTKNRNKNFKRIRKCISRNDDERLFELLNEGFTIFQMRMYDLIYMCQVQELLEKPNAMNASGSLKFMVEAMKRKTKNLQEIVKELDEYLNNVTYNLA